MTEKIVERVARAMFENSREESASRGIQSSWENYPLKEHFINMARAAIAAMRDPTIPMILAGRAASNTGELIDGTSDETFLNADRVFNAMIDRALKD